MPGNQRLRATWLVVAVLAVAALPALAAVPVRVMQPRAADFGEQFQLTGTLTADRAAGLSPRVDGLVREVKVDAGDRVEAGQLLVQLDDAVARHTLARVRAEAAEAEATAAEAQRLLDEGRRLAADKFIPASQVGTLEARLSQARAAADSARAAVAEQQELVRRHALPAPFAGVVSAKHAEAGEWVQRGDTVLDLVATDRVRLDLQVPQERFAALAGEATVQDQRVSGNVAVVRHTLAGATIPPGETEYFFDIQMLADLAPEEDEYFRIDVSNVVNAWNTDIRAFGIIIDDDTNVDGVPTVHEVAADKGRLLHHDGRRATHW